MKLTIAEKNAERFASCEHVIAHFNTLYKFDVATGNATGIKIMDCPLLMATATMATTSPSAARRAKP